MCVYRAEGHHIDGRSVSRVGHDLPALIKEVAEDGEHLRMTPVVAVQLA